MAAIYRGECAACGAPSPISQVGYLACRLDDGEIRPLPHPIENTILQELGYTFRQATDEQRLIWVTNVVCDTCGYIAQRHAVKPRDSWLAYLVMLATSFAICIWGFFAGLLVFYLLSLIYTRIERRFTREAQELLPAPPTCPNCRHAEFRSFSNISRKRSVCRECGERSVEYELYARS